MIQNVFRIFERIATATEKTVDRLDVLEATMARIADPKTPIVVPDAPAIWDAIIELGGCTVHRDFDGNIVFATVSPKTLAQAVMHATTRAKKPEDEETLLARGLALP